MEYILPMDIIADLLANRRQNLVWSIPDYGLAQFAGSLSMVAGKGAPHGGFNHPVPPWILRAQTGKVSHAHTREQICGLVNSTYVHQRSIKLYQSGIIAFTGAGPTAQAEQARVGAMMMCVVLCPLSTAFTSSLARATFGKIKWLVRLFPGLRGRRRTNQRSRRSGL